MRVCKQNNKCHSASSSRSDELRKHRSEKTQIFAPAELTTLLFAPRASPYAFSDAINKTSRPASLVAVFDSDTMALVVDQMWHQFIRKR